MAATDSISQSRAEAVGDFWLRDLPEDDWMLTIEGFGRTKVIEVSTKTGDIGLGDIALA